MEQNYECNGCKKTKTEIKELQGTIKDLIKDIKVLQEIHQNEDSFNCSIQSAKKAVHSAGSSQSFGKDNRVFSSTSVCLKQTNNTSEDNGSYHVVDISLGKILVM